MLGKEQAKVTPAVVGCGEVRQAKCNARQKQKREDC